jgi:RNA polymerase sigma-70 factor (ECF subfamily)
VSAPYASLSDGELATLSASGRDAAFSELMRRHRAAVYRLILGNVANPEDALDLVQETFVSAHGALGRYDAQRPMAAWLARIALNKCRDWGRRRAVRRFFSLARPIDEVADGIADERASPDIEAADRQELARLSRAIADLPTSLREPLVLCSIDGMSQAEAAEILDISEKAVETRIRRARIRLGEVLGDR